MAIISKTINIGASLLVTMSFLKSSGTHAGIFPPINKPAPNGRSLLHNAASRNGFSLDDAFNGTDAEAVISSLYRAFAVRDKAWTIVSSAPDHGLQIAFPDSACTYYSTSFSGLKPGEMVRVSGRFPSWANYAAITAYDTAGLPYNSSSFKDDCCSDSKEFSLEFTGKDGGSEPFNIIYRLYRPLGKPWDATEYGLPSMTVGPDVSSLEPAALQSAEFWGNKLNKPFQTFLGNNLLKEYTNMEDKGQLYMPNNKMLGANFPNPDAGYLIAKYTFAEDTNPNSGEASVFILNAMLPEESPDWDFYGFMLSEASTTATLMSTFDEQMGGWGTEYKVFIARSQKAAEAAGYRPDTEGHILLSCSVDECPKPLLVFRQISTDSETGLNSLKKLADLNDVSANVVMETLGTAYPQMEEVTVNVHGSIHVDEIGTTAGAFENDDESSTWRAAATPLSTLTCMMIGLAAGIFSM